MNSLVAKSKIFKVGKDGPRQRVFSDNVVRTVEPTARSKRANQQNKSFHKGRMNDPTRSNKDSLSAGRSLQHDIQAGAEITALENKLKASRNNRDKSVNKRKPK